MYGLRMSEIIGLRTFNIDLEKMQFGVVEQMPFKVPPGTKIITEMAPTKSNDPHFADHRGNAAVFPAAV